jgi:hypothetical protein
LTLIAEREKDTTKAKQAVKQVQEALEATRAGGHGPNAAYFERQLSEAQAILSRLEKN